MPIWKGQLTIGPRIGVDVAIDVMAKQVSVVKPVCTRLHWKNLLPNDLYVTVHAQMDTVEDDLFQLDFDAVGDFVTLSLEPASGTDSSAFDKLSRHLVSKKRYATISHRGHVAVKKIYLVPEIPQIPNPKPIRSLDYKVLPRVQTKNTMFMVIDYYDFSRKKAPILEALNDTILAVHSSDMSDLAGIRERLIQRPLPIYQHKSTTVFSMAVFGAEWDLGSLLSSLPLSKGVVDANLAKHPNTFLKLSYPKLDQHGPTSIDGVKLPESVFVLGMVVDRGGVVRELAVVDIENKNRPLWMIPSSREYANRLGTSIGLLTSKFPHSWKEWEKTIDTKLGEVQMRKQLKDTGLRIERF